MQAARFTDVVVFPTPPFWLTTAKTKSTPPFDSRAEPRGLTPRSVPDETRLRGLGSSLVRNAGVRLLKRALRGRLNSSTARCPGVESPGLYLRNPPSRVRQHARPRRWSGTTQARSKTGLPPLRFIASSAPIAPPLRITSTSARRFLPEFV